MKTYQCPRCGDKVSDELHPCRNLRGHVDTPLPDKDAEIAALRTDIVTLVAEIHKLRGGLPLLLSRQVSTFTLLELTK